MKLLSTLFFVLLCAGVFGQQVITWSGGAPGKQTEWDEPRNWIPNRVPDELSHVVIREANNGHNSMPVINSEVVIQSLEIIGNSTLNIAEQGSLSFDGMHFIDGLLTVTREKLIGVGKITYTDNAENEGFDPFARNGLNPF